MLGCIVRALALLSLSGCVTLTGPCRLELKDEARSLECEANGSATILAPARLIEAAASAARQKKE